MIEFYWVEKTCNGKETYEEIMKLVEEFGGMVHSVYSHVPNVFTVLSSFPNREQLNLFNATYRQVSALGKNMKSKKLSFQV